VRPSVLLCLCGLLLASGWGSQGSFRVRGPRSPADVRLWRFHYRAHDGQMRAAWLSLPSWYGPDRHPALPLVISPHGRGVDGHANARLWGRLPALYRLAVVNPDGQGRRLPLYSWGYGGQISDLARMPDLVRRALPWLRVAHDRVYAIAASMGGQEALLLTGQYPNLLEGTVVFDAPTDFALEYRLFPRLPCNAVCRRQWKGPIGIGLQHLARVEVGGSPRQAPGAYDARSPARDVGAIARSRVPLGLWWSVRDRIVPAREEQVFLHALQRRRPHDHIHHVTGFWPHALAMRLNLAAALEWLHLAQAGPLRQERA
jgi:pimeloyl-ACP methyl ester carboxylesterase